MAQSLCPKCGGTLESTAASCPHCGEATTGNAAKPGRLLGVIAVLLVIVGVTVFFVLPRVPPVDNQPVAVPASPPVDFKALEARVEAGEAEAMNALGKAYLEGNGVEVDYAKAAELFKQAAELGHADAQANLGLLYDAGQGVPVDFAEAMKWFKRAAEQNHPAAAYNVGSMYGSARGVDENIPESTKWYMKSAQLGDEYAQYNVAQRYHLGVGVEIDLVEAYKWYELSARKGVPDSIEARDKLNKTLTKNQIQDAMDRVSKWNPASTGG